MRVLPTLALAAVTGYLATAVTYYLLWPIVDLAVRLLTTDQYTRQSVPLFFWVYDVNRKVDICVSELAAAGFVLFVRPRK